MSNSTHTSYRSIGCLKRLALVFIAACLVGFIACILSGYDEIHFDFIYLTDFSIQLSAWVGLATGLIAGIIYGIKLVFTQWLQINDGRQSRLAYWVKHGLLLSSLSLVGVYTGVMLLEGMRYAHMAPDIDGSSPTIELRSSALFEHYLPSEFLHDESMDMDEFEQRDNAFSATIITLPFYPIMMLYLALVSGYIYVVGCAIYLDGLVRGSLPNITTRRDTSAY